MSVTSALLKKQLWTTANLRRVALAQSSFKWGFVSLFVLLFEVGLLFLFHDSFRFLDSFGGIGTMVINRLFSLYFLAMGLMLIASSLVTAYATIFRSEEIPFLLTRPFDAVQIITYKFYEATALSSWAFFFIILPFIAAYGWHEHYSPLFAVWTLLFSLPYLVLCCALGTLIVLLVVRWAPRGRLVRVGALLALLALTAGAWWWTRAAAEASLGGQFNISAFVPGLRLSANMLIPSAWVAEGILALASGEWLRGVMLWITTVATAALLGVAVEWVGEHVFYEAWQRVMGSKAHVARRPVLFAWAGRWLRGLPPDVRAMVLKDIRTFLRDPIQWSQALIFFGMLALYFGNLRALHYDRLPDHWRNMIGFLNVFSVSAVVASFGSRFVYPQLSLEGHGFWVLGLAPTSMRRVVLTKFVGSVLAMVLISLALTLLSTSMLGMGWLARGAAVLLVSAVATAACGLSTGLGAVHLDLKQRNPAAIVSGFGGTLNLVLCLGFMLLTIVPVGLLFHLHALGTLADATLRHWMPLAVAWVVTLTVATTVLPLMAGIRSMARREY